MESTGVPMTKAGEQALKEELKHLIDVERPSISKAISEAREHGDLKENAEYHSAKDKQGMIEARIAFIQSRLQNAQVIDIARFQGKDTVMFGATLTLLHLDTEKRMVFQIVGEEEADLKKQKLSVTAPLARACIGKAVDDVVEVQTPSGVAEYEITKIEYIVA